MQALDEVPVLAVLARMTIVKTFLQGRGKIECLDLGGLQSPDLRAHCGGVLTVGGPHLTRVFAKLGGWIETSSLCITLMLLVAGTEM